MIDIKALNYMQLSKNAKQGALKFDPKILLNSGMLLFKIYK